AVEQGALGVVAAHRRVDLALDRLLIDAVLGGLEAVPHRRVFAERVAAGRARGGDLRRERALAELQHLQLGLELLAALVELDRVGRRLVPGALEPCRLSLPRAL